MVQRSHGPNGHIQIIQRAQDKILREYSTRVPLKTRNVFDIVGFDVEVEVEDDA